VAYVLKIAVAGVAGRMGRTLVQAVVEANLETSASEIILSAAVQRPGSTLLGADVGELSGIGRIENPW